MTHYEQALKHWGNHRKDRFTQECGGPHIEASGKSPWTDYEIEIENRDGGTDFYLQLAITNEQAIELFIKNYDEPCIVRRVWNPTTETRESTKLLNIKIERT